jgi:hypothetical protein
MWLAREKEISRGATVSDTFGTREAGQPLEERGSNPSP